MAVLIIIFHVVRIFISIMPALVVFGSIIPNEWLSWLAVIGVIAFSWKFDFAGSILGLILWVVGVPLAFIHYPLPFAIFYTVICVANIVGVVIRFIRLSKDNRPF